MPTPEPQIDDDIAHEPFDWQEWLEASDHYCQSCDGLFIFLGYDPIRRGIDVYCDNCREEDFISTENTEEE